MAENRFHLLRPPLSLKSIQRRGRPLSSLRRAGRPSFSCGSSFQKRYRRRCGAASRPLVGSLLEWFDALRMTGRAAPLQRLAAPAAVESQPRSSQLGRQSYMAAPDWPTDRRWRQFLGVKLRTSSTSDRPPGPRGLLFAWWACSRT